MRDKARAEIPLDSTFFLTPHRFHLTPVVSDLTEEIEEVAHGPRAVQTDGTRVDAQDVGDLIKADKHLASKASAATANRGLRFNKLVPPGTTA